MSSVNIIQRAFELANAGECRTVAEIERRLHREGYSHVIDHLAGMQIRAELRSLIHQVRKSCAAQSAGT